MNDDYDPKFDTLSDLDFREGEDYSDFSHRPNKPGLMGDILTAIKVMINERTVVPLAKPQVSGNVRLFTYAMYPLVGLIIGIVMMIWVNIAYVIPLSIFLTALIGVILVYAVQAGHPLIGFGQAADALFSSRRKETKMRILMGRTLRPSAVFAALLLAAGQLVAFFYLFIRMSIWRGLFSMLAVFILSRALGSLLTLSLAPLEPEEDGDMKTLRTVQTILYAMIALSAVGLILTGSWSALVSIVVIGLTQVLCHSHFNTRYRGITRKMSKFMVAASETLGLLALILPLGTFLWK
ncbi:MAG TPA: adenosylcobinamide-GDP ribazoletransferase [Fastidiosipila sp.]|nr:adenosylcobinamide-GDP ribazoletransferase [Fastidiosipila sp.]